jgi:hypothetical protein
MDYVAEQISEIPIESTITNDVTKKVHAVNSVAVSSFVEVQISDAVANLPVPDSTVSENGTNSVNSKAVIAYHTANTPAPVPERLLRFNSECLNMAEDYDWLDIHYEQMELNAGDYIDIHSNNSVKLFAQGTGCHIKPDEMNFTVNGNINFKAYSAGAETTCQVKNDGFYVDDDKIKPIPDKLLKFDSECLSLDTQLTIKHENTINLNATNQNIHLLALNGYVILVGNVIVDNRGYGPVSDTLLKLAEHLTYSSSSDMIHLESRHISFRSGENGSITLWGTNDTTLKVNPDSIEIKSFGGKVDITGDVYVNSEPLPMPVYRNHTIDFPFAITEEKWKIAEGNVMKFGKFVHLHIAFFPKQNITINGVDEVIGTLSDELLPALFICQPATHLGLGISLHSTLSTDGRWDLRSRDEIIIQSGSHFRVDFIYLIP